MKKHWSTEVFVFTLMGLIPVVLFSSWVTTVLWTWFMLPFGAPRLTLAWAVGLGCLVSHFLPKPKIDDSELTCLVSNFLPKPKIDDSELMIEKSLARFIQHVLCAVLLLGLGWIAHLCM